MPTVVASSSPSGCANCRYTTSFSPRFTRCGATPMRCRQSPHTPKSAPRRVSLTHRLALVCCHEELDAECGRTPCGLCTWSFLHILHVQVLGGADLFLAGVIVPPEGLPQFATGQPMAVRVPGHPFPFAVGVMECSSAEAQKNGMKGRGEMRDFNSNECGGCRPVGPEFGTMLLMRADGVGSPAAAGLKLLHTYTDLLWGMGPGTVPHPSFTPGRIFSHVRLGLGGVTAEMCIRDLMLFAPVAHPLSAAVDQRDVVHFQDSPEHQVDSDATSATAAANGMQQLSVSDARPSAAAGDPAAAAQPGTAPAGAAPQAAAGAAADANGAAPANAPAPADPPETAAAPAVDSSSPDAVAVHCLLAGCHSVDDADLPIMTSDFQSKHMLPNLPEGKIASHWSCMFRCVPSCIDCQPAYGILLSARA